MNEDRLIELVVKMHDGLPRLGPGNAESTLKALSCCHELPPSARVLDVGCGTGSQTLILASELSDARVTATDLFPKFLTQLKTEAERQGWVDRIEIKEADMNALPFPENSFDLIWIVDYYAPLRKRLPLFRRENADDEDAQAIADMTEQEMKIITANFEYCGYEFYVFQRAS